MKKIILLIIVIFGVCGCSVDYKIEISENGVIENLTASASNNQDEMEYYENSKKQDYIPYLGTQDNYFEKSYDENNNKIILEYSYDSYTLYSFSKAFKNCFQSSSIISNDDEVIIKAQDFVCYGYDYIILDSLKVDIIINDYDVISHNANKVSNNTYIWQMVNEKMPNIELVLKQKKELETPIIETCQKKCNEGEQLVNPDSKNCYCQVIDRDDNDNDKVEDEDNLLNYILVGAVLLLFAIGIFGLIKYKSINKDE